MRTSHQVPVEALQTLVPLFHAVDHAVFLHGLRHQLRSLHIGKDIRPGIVHNAVFRAETVQHQKVRAARQRHGNAQPLPHAEGEIFRFLLPGAVQPHQVQQLRDAVR